MEDEADGLTISVSREGGPAAVVTVAGDIDIVTASELRTTLDGLGPDVDDVTLEMSEVGFVDSSGIAVVLDAAGRLERLVLRSPSRAVVRLVEATGLAGVLPIEP
jgi:anti-anti-sigma factor